MRRYGRILVAATLCVVVVWACSGIRASSRPDVTYSGHTARPRYAATGDPARPPLRFAVIGDFGNDSKNEADVAALVKSWRPEFVMTTGDNNYPLGLPLTIDRNIGKYYGDFIGNYGGSYGRGAPENRFWPCAGNHDWYAPDGLRPYLDYFYLPGNERYYDVDLGTLHLFAVDSDEHEPDGISASGPQARWLKDVMARSKACFKIVYFHHPPYTSGRHGNAKAMQWPFKEWGADLVLSGHDHTYERIVVDGLTYIVNGLGGADIYPFVDVLKESVVRFNGAHGAQLATLAGNTLTLEFRDVGNEVRDTFTLTKDCPVQGVQPTATKPSAGEGKESR